MTFADADLIRVLELVLPARFGGGLTDSATSNRRPVSSAP